MKETTENNILLAEFLGYIDNGCSENGFLIDPNTNYDIEIENLKFHASWNWLMLVVDKIENDHPMSVIISCSNCEIYNCETQETIFHLEGVKIEATYNACIQFVKWFNSQSK